MFRRRQPPVTPASADEPALPNRLSPRSPSEAIKPTAAPPPPKRPERRRGGLIGTLSGLLTLSVVLAIAAMIGLSVFQRQTREPGPLTADKVVVIPLRSGTSEIAEALSREGVISQTGMFELAARLSGKALKAGEYQFKAQSSLSEVIDVLAAGRQVQHAITFPEGLTSEQIVGRLNEDEVLAGDINEIPPEGSLLPDTYKFERGATRQRIVELMKEKQRTVLKDIWQRRSADIPVKTPAEMVTLASIVEKETGRADERPRVAGVFVNRLNKRMKLQSDPTIVYGIVYGRGTLGRGIRREEIERATPYNTYVIEGLPPGPIANPGRAALEAVANPSRTKDLFFVADGTGGHAFAETLEAHGRNVARWRQVERSRQTPATPDAGAVDKVEPPLESAAGGKASTYAPAGLNFALGGGDATGQKSKAFDASEGTRLDPLRNKTFDLNSAKSVPVLKQP